MQRPENSADFRRCHHNSAGLEAGFLWWRQHRPVTATEMDFPCQIKNLENFAVINTEKFTLWPHWDWIEIWTAMTVRNKYLTEIFRQHSQNCKLKLKISHGIFTMYFNDGNSIFGKMALMARWSIQLSYKMWAVQRWILLFGIIFKIATKQIANIHLNPKWTCP